VNGAEGFKDGIVFCELVKLYKRRAIPGVIYDTSITIENSLRNISTSIKEIKNLIELDSRITPEGVYNSEDIMFKYLESIKSLFDNTRRSPEFVKCKESSLECIDKSSKATKLMQTTPSNKPITQPSIDHSVKVHKDNSIKTDIKTKHKIIKWLEKISLLKANAVSIDEFPSYCRNGVLLYDLITRLEGRQELGLKQLNRNPKTFTSVYVNISKCLKYLQSCERMNPRCLWSVKEIANGNENVIWALLDDMWYFYHNKISPSDSSYSKIISYSSLRGSMRRKSLPSVNINTKENADGTPSFKRNSARTLNQNKNINSYSFIHSKRSLSRDALEKPNKSMRSKSLITKEQKQKINNWLTSFKVSPASMNSPYLDKQQVFNKLTALLTGMSKPLFNKTEDIYSSLHRIFGSSISSKYIEGIRKQDVNIIWEVLNKIMQLHTKQDSQLDTNDDKEGSIIDWLKRLELIRSNIKTLDEINKEIRNGILLCELAEILTKKRLCGIFKLPKTNITAQSNIQKALESLRTLPKINHK